MLIPQSPDSYRGLIAHRSLILHVYVGKQP
jgi:hypothetical protein